MHVNVVSGLDSTNDHPSVGDVAPARRVGGEEPAEQPFRAGQLARAQLDLGERQQQHRIVAGAVLVEELAGAGEIALLERRLRQNRSRLAFERIDADELLERVDRLRGPALLEQVVVQRLEALAGFLFLAHLLERAGGGEPGLEVCRVDRARAGRRFPRRRGDRPSRGGARQWR